MQQIYINECTDFTTPEINKFITEARKYYKYIKDESLLTPEELVKNNMLFVVSVAKKYANNNIPLEDIIQYGLIGLIEASHKYDPTKGFRFISFAVAWIQKEIIEGITKSKDLIRIPQNIQTGFNKINKFIKSYYIKNECIPSINEVAENINVDKRIIDEYFCKSTINSIDKIYKNKYEHDCSILEDYDGSISSNWEDNEYNLYKVESLLKNLPKIDADMIRMYYINGDSIIDIARKYKFKEARVSNHIKKGINKLRSICK